MSLKIYDFMCSKCNEKFEGMVESDTRFHPCPYCSELCERVISAPLIGKMNNPNTLRETLRKRSAEHTKKELGHSHEKFGLRPTETAKWNIRSNKKENN